MDSNLNSPLLFDLKDRVVLLTGSTGHIGRSLALGLCQANATLILSDLDPEGLARQTANLSNKGGRVDALVLDVTNESQRQKAVREIGQRYGRLDVLINNAYGIGSAQGFAAFQRSYEVAVSCVHGLIGDAIELMNLAAERNTRGASIINMASMYGVVSPDPRIYTSKTQPNPPFYGPAKAGLIQLTRYLACQLGPRRIRVNAISPGPFPAPAVAAHDPEFIRNLGMRSPLGRIGAPEELVGPVVFLASDAGSYVTGANLAVDGGWTSW
jgi:NAD(P)-dependent dehydrogenase (short-subunit alcohol dehydrogenase family)